MSPTRWLSRLLRRIRDRMERRAWDRFRRQHLAQSEYDMTRQPGPCHRLRRLLRRPIS